MSGFKRGITKIITYKRGTVFTSFFLLMSLMLYDTSSKGENTENLESPIGTNLHYFTNYSPDWVFLDVFAKTQSFHKMLCSGEWNEGPDLTTDSNGWITSLQTNQCAGCYLFDQVNGNYPGGEYVLLWEGDGTFQISGDANFTHTQGSSVQQSNGLNRATFQVSSPSNNGLFLRISSVASDYLRNIRLIMPGGVCGQDINNLNYFGYCQTSRGGSGTCSSDETCYDFEDIYWDRFNDPDSEMNNPKVVFHPKYLERLQQYRGIRAVNWMAVHGNVLQNWADRAGLQKQTYADYGRGSSTKPNRGVPYDIFIALCSILNADMWLTIPVQTTDDFNTQFATLVKNKLNSNLKLYVEYGNEHWNTAPYFSDEWNYLLSKANVSGSGIPSSDSDNIKVAKYYSKRAVEIHTIWRSVFAGSESRIIRLLAGHTADPYYTQQMLDWQNAYQNADALAIHGYFAGKLNSAANESAILAMSVDDVFTEINNGGLGAQSSLARTNSHYTTNYTLANTRGLDLVAYEGGQHLVAATFSQSAQDTIYNLFVSANRDPRMGTAYLTNANNWKIAGGKEFFHFTNLSWWSKYGTKGALEYQDQPRSEAPKYDAIMSFIEQNGCWWGNCVNCSGDIVVINNITFTSGNTYNCIATTSITVATGVTVKNGATVTFMAPTVKIQSGFNAETGSVVNIKQQQDGYGAGHP